MKKKYFLLYLFFFFLAGCASNIETFHSTESLGKQLDDLQQAYKAGAVTEKEYKKGKEILIDHYK